MTDNAIDKFKEQFVDGDYKIIVECPECGDQTAIYLIRCNQIIKGYCPQYCDNCKMPYLVEVKTDLTCTSRTFGCHQIIEKSTE